MECHCLIRSCQDTDDFDDWADDGLFYEYTPGVPSSLPATPNAPTGDRARAPNRPSEPTTSAAASGHVDGDKGSVDRKSEGKGPKRVKKKGTSKPRSNAAAEPSAEPREAKAKRGDSSAKAGKTAGSSQHQNAQRKNGAGSNPKQVKNGAGSNPKQAKGRPQPTGTSAKTDTDTVPKKGNPPTRVKKGTKAQNSARNAKPAATDTRSTKAKSASKGKQRQPKGDQDTSGATKRVPSTSRAKRGNESSENYSSAKPAEAADKGIPPTRNNSAKARAKPPSNTTNQKPAEPTANQNVASSPKNDVSQSSSANTNGTQPTPKPTNEQAPDATATAAKNEQDTTTRALQYLIRGIHIDPVHVKYLLSDECKDAEAICDAIDRLSRAQRQFSPNDFQAAISVR